MKKGKKSQGVVKGAPSGFIISLMVHAAAFMLAGLLVVFTVHQKEEKKFIPPKPVDRPKMKLKKPKVKVKKTAKPKPTTRIVTKVKRASMPDIQLPEMSGMTAGLVGGVGGFEIMPDLGEVSLFGGNQSIGNDFVGTFYDFKRDRRGQTIPMAPETFVELLGKFISKGWRSSELARFYRSPKKLYATSFAIPAVQSSLAPSAFDEEDTIGYCWAAHYKGQLVHHKDITFRFWGMGDDVLLVRVDGNVVLNASWPSPRWNTEGILGIAADWQSSSADSRKYVMGNNLSVVGDWITLEAGVPLNMEVIIGEGPGGVFCSMLCVEEEGVEYERNVYLNGPVLPIFKTEQPSLDLVEAIHADLHVGDAVVTNGPVFKDYVSNGGTAAAVSEEPDTPEAPAIEPNRMRIWKNTNGKTFEAEYMTVVAGQLVVKTANGKQIKIPVDQLSEEDRIYLDLANPPDFSLEFSKTSEQVQPPEDSPFLGGDPRPYRASDYTFGVKIRQKSSRIYNHALTVEYFAFAEEVDGDNYKLLDRKSSTFTPLPENKQSIEFYGEKSRIEQASLRSSASMRGTKYGGFLITVTDERGEIIQYKTSHDWLYENLENLKKIPKGKHFNKSCIRVGPPRPGPDARPDWV